MPNQRWSKSRIWGGGGMGGKSLPTLKQQSVHPPPPGFQLLGLLFLEALIKDPHPGPRWGCVTISIICKEETHQQDHYITEESRGVFYVQCPTDRASYNHATGFCLSCYGQRGHIEQQGITS